MRGKSIWNIWTQIKWDTKWDSLSSVRSRIYLPVFLFYHCWPQWPGGDDVCIFAGWGRKQKWNGKLSLEHFLSQKLLKVCVTALESYHEEVLWTQQRIGPSSPSSSWQFRFPINVVQTIPPFNIHFQQCWKHSHWGSRQSFTWIVHLLSEVSNT